MSDLLTVFGPIGLVACGGLVALGSEAFLNNKAKHQVLPWVGSVFLALAALALLLGPACCGNVVSVGHLYAMDSARAWLVLAVIASAACGLAGLQQSLRRDQYPGGEAYALTLLAATGVGLMVQSASYMGLFVGLELASIAIYATVGMRRHRLESGEALLKYFVMGAVFSALFLYGVALSYGATGSFAYGAHAQDGRENLLRFGQVFIVIGLLFKVGAVPFHFWSPDAYTGAPIAITGFMAAVMKIGGFVALGTIWLHQVAGGVDAGTVLDISKAVTIDTAALPDLGVLLRILAGVAVLSLLVGNFSALKQSRLRRLMAFSSVSHAGYMLLAFALPAVVDQGVSFSLTSLWFYLIAYAVASAAALALIASVAGEEDEDDLEELAGAGRRHVVLGVLLSILVASLAGLPPTGGFLGKYLIFGELVAKGQVGMAILGMLMAVIGAIYYVGFIINIWSGDGEMAGEQRVGGLAYGAGALAAVISLGLLFLPDLTTSKLESTTTDSSVQPVSVAPASGQQVPNTRGPAIVPAGVDPARAGSR